MAVENAAQILMDTARHRTTFTTYPTRENYAGFAEGLISYWMRGHMQDDDFRARLCALSVCEIADNSKPEKEYPIR